jgi:hypothetical protein
MLTNQKSPYLVDPAFTYSTQAQRRLEWAIRMLSHVNQKIGLFLRGI